MKSSSQPRLALAYPESPGRTTRPVSFTGELLALPAAGLASLASGPDFEHPANGTAPAAAAKPVRAPRRVQPSSATSIPCSRRFTPTTDALGHQLPTSGLAAAFRLINSRKQISENVRHCGNNQSMRCRQLAPALAQ